MSHLRAARHCRDSVTYAIRTCGNPLPYPYPYSDNFLNGGLESLRGCTALHILDAYGNQLTGGLEFLQDFTRLRELDVQTQVITLTLTLSLTLQ